MDNNSNNIIDATYNEHKVDVYNPIVIYQRMADKVLQNFKSECQNYKINGTLKNKIKDVIESTKYKLSVDGNWYFMLCSKQQKEEISKLKIEVKDKLKDEVKKILANLS